MGTDVNDPFMAACNLLNRESAERAKGVNAARDEASQMYTGILARRLKDDSRESDGHALAEFLRNGILPIQSINDVERDLAALKRALLQASLDDDKQEAHSRSLELRAEFDAWKESAQQEHDRRERELSLAQIHARNCSGAAYELEKIRGEFPHLFPQQTAGSQNVRSYGYVPK